MAMKLGVEDWEWKVQIDFYLGPGLHSNHPERLQLVRGEAQVRIWRMGGQSAI